jgi:hypothetical protein
MSDFFLHCVACGTETEDRTMKKHWHKSTEKDDWCPICWPSTQGERMKLGRADELVTVIHQAAYTVLEILLKELKKK